MYELKEIYHQLDLDNGTEPIERLELNGNKYISRKKITVLIPAYNEEASIPELIYQLNELSIGKIQPQLIAKDPSEKDIPSMRDYDWEFLFINDGSKDNTLKMLLEARKQDERINIVNLSRNFGKENALLAGMDFAKGQAVIIIDADLQHPLSTIPLMVKEWEEGFDDVYGQRITRGKESWLRKKLSLTYYRLLQGTTRIQILPNVGDFRLLDKRVINEITKLRETQRYTKGLYCWVGFKKKSVPFETQERVHGQSSFNFRSLLNLAIEGITSYTVSPLRIATILGFIVSLLAIVYSIFIIIKTIVQGETVQGFPTLMCVILLLGGIQLISIGIIGEYIGRIFNESKNRPVYIAESYNGNKI